MTIVVPQIPLKDAVREELQKFVERHDGVYEIEKKVKYHDDDSTPGFETNTPRFVQLLHAKRVANGAVTTEDITPICQQMNTELGTAGAEPLADKQVAKMIKVLNTPERLVQWLEYRQEPLLRGESEDVAAMMAVDEVVKGTEFDTLMAEATKLEKQNCSWEATIGPAMKALRRLGRTSAGKDFDKLANYAKDHGKPPR
jgi:hypothetical protein